MVVIACNAASTVAPEDERVLHMIQAGLQAVRYARTNKLGIVGGYRTIESEVYKKPLLTEHSVILQEVAQALSIRMEAGDLESNELDEDIHRIFHPLRFCDGILLACTHYPALTKRIQPVVPNSQLIDPMNVLVDQLFTRFPDLSGNATSVWLTTGSVEKMKIAAEKAFQILLNDIQHIAL